ncbi:MAG: hypothetical protein MAG795_01012 [Candidatus Woesearchaeota archaeon]|nr:hypothetical protein [Candidatus Woesearchaeota archaeon]
MKNKKGSFYPFIIVFISLAILITTYIFLTQVTLNQEIGDEQLEIFNSYHKGEEFIFYMELAGKYSSNQAVHELAQRGGFAAESECGQFKGHNMWNYLGKECIPDPTVSYEFIFNEKIIKYSSNFQEELKLKYNLDFTDSGFIASPKNMVDIIIQDDEDNPFMFRLGNEIDYTEVEPEKDICRDVADGAIKSVEMNCKFAVDGNPDIPNCDQGLNSVDFNNFALTQIDNPQPKISGPGMDFCKNGEVYDLTVEIEKKQLKPGDFVSVNYPGIDGQTKGHTAVYVGKGKVSDPADFWVARCFKEFIADESGEHIFASSIGWLDYDPPPPHELVGRSCFTPDSMFFSFYNSPHFCRLTTCNKNNLIRQAGPKSIGEIPKQAKGVYSIYPSINIKQEYDFEEYNIITDQFEEYITNVENCRNLVGDPGEPPTFFACIISRKPDNWQLVDSEDEKYLFSVESEHESDYSDPSGILVNNKKVEYMFALHFPN